MYAVASKRTDRAHSTSHARRAASQTPNIASTDEPTYVSFTIWNSRKDFQTWFKSDAFKEAHGGGTIFGFVDMLVNATFTLNGAPKPAFWHGLLPISMPGNMEGKEVENGWRVVNADGKDLLPGETFVSANRFSVAEGSEAAFEQRSAALNCKSLALQCCTHTCFAAAACCHVLTSAQ